MAKILIVEDNREMRETLDQLFSFYDFTVLTSDNGKTGIEIAEKEMPDIILLDAYMPVMDGFEACQKLKTNSRTKDIAVVFLSAKYIEPENKIEGLQLGADDYILKPFNSKELVTRIKTILKKTSVMRVLKENNERLSLSNDRINEELKKLQINQQDKEQNVITDPLTGLRNKEYFLKRLKEEFNRSLRYDLSQSVILIEVDQFDQIIDNYGHQVGDYILMKMANIILNNTRLVDISARYDGEIFGIILPQTETQGAFFEGEKLRVSLEGADYVSDIMIDVKNTIRRRKIDLNNITVSIGIATFTPGMTINSEKRLIDYAKKAIVKAKSSGKNRTVAYNEVE